MAAKPYDVFNPGPCRCYALRRGVETIYAGRFFDPEVGRNTSQAGCALRGNGFAFLH